MRKLAPRKTVPLLSAGLLFVAAVFVGACSDSKSAGIPCPAKVDATVKGLDNFKFDVTELAAKPGKWTMKLVNTSATGHNFKIRGIDGEAAAAAGKDGCEEFELTAGTYPFYCSLPGHEAGGMKGTLTVS